MVHEQSQETYNHDFWVNNLALGALGVFTAVSLTYVAATSPELAEQIRVPLETAGTLGIAAGVEFAAFSLLKVVNKF